MWFFDALERHVLVLYFYSILAGFGVALYVAWGERQGTPTIGAIFAALGLGLVIAILGPYTVVISMHELFKENAKNPVAATLGCMVAVIALPLAYLIAVPSQANTVYFALTLAWIFAVAWHATGSSAADHSSESY